MSTLNHNETIKSQTKKDGATNTERRTSQCENMGRAGDLTLGNAEFICENRLLFLTIPHLSYAIQDHPECDQKSVLIACYDGRNGHSTPRQNQRNSPLRVIAQILGFHKKQPPFAEMKMRFYLQQDGSFYQELLLPQGWVICDQQHHNTSVKPVM